MGKLDTEPVIHHFSHQHPLKLVNFQPQTPNLSTCSGCKLEASGWIYSCSACNYYLHKPCSQMPQNLNHPIDPNHTLVLLSSPVYPEGAFKCNACGKLGNGFCYHCKECQLDLHTLCAFMPSSVKHNAHHHTLNLCFNPPYHNKGFQCDACKGSGSNCWLYRCSSCEFDAHMNCAMANIQQREQQQLVKSRSAPRQPYHHFPPPARPLTPQMRIESIQNQYPVPRIGLISNGTQPFDQVNYYGGVPNSVVPQFVQPRRTNNIGNDLRGYVVQGIVDGIAQQAGQAILQGILGGL